MPKSFSQVPDHVNLPLSALDDSSLNSDVFIGDMDAGGMNLCADIFPFKDGENERISIRPIGDFAPTNVAEDDDGFTFTTPSGKVVLTDRRKNHPTEYSLDAPGVRMVFKLDEVPTPDENGDILYGFQLGGDWENFRFHIIDDAAMAAANPRHAGTDVGRDGGINIKHKTKRNHVLGGTNYFNGLFAALIAPWAKGLDGVMRYGVFDLRHISTGIIYKKFKVEDFSGGAPFDMDLDIGLTTDPGSDYGLITGDLIGCNFDSSLSAGQVTKNFNVLGRVTNNSWKCRCGVYDEASSTTAGNKLDETAVSGNFTNTSLEWKQLPLNDVAINESGVFLVVGAEHTGGSDSCKLRYQFPSAGHNLDTLTGVDVDSPLPSPLNGTFQASSYELCFYIQVQPATVEGTPKNKGSLAGAKIGIS